MDITMQLNGEARTLSVPSNAMLLDAIRDNGLTGSKEGCAVGVCGLCTVVVDDRPVSSCIYLAALADGSSVWTIEGLASRDPGLVEAFIVEEGMQCGICTPGQMVAAYALKREAPDATPEEIREYMAGNLCRCTGYVTIMASVANYLDRE